MRRLLVLLLCLLLCGCEPASNISIAVLEESRVFSGFTAEKAMDPEPAAALVDSILAQYPQGFSGQWGTVEVLLVGNLTGTGHFAGGRYAGFTQRTDDGWQMVLDVDRCSAGTIHHEIAHILDGILTEAGVLTEDAWMAFCPGGFTYGQGAFDDYPDFFADAYAMTSLREDRARTFEDAALYGPGVYADRPAMWLKMEYFSRAIREHFDTTGWPEQTFWELALQ